jgi:SAM-dependent methyltransferase
VFSLVRRHVRMLAHLGIVLNERARVLDFGCGSGSYVYEYRDEGFDAYGFEVSPASVKFRKPEDERFFCFSPPEGYRIPFDSGFFDFVFSCEVFEHVPDYDAALGEIARVLKPGGVSIHTFPARYRLLEPHVRVPLGGFIQSYTWYLLWALLGVRNEFQRTMGPVARAQNNLTWMRSSTHYLGTAEILRFAQKHFREVDLVPHLWHLENSGYGCLGALLFLLPIHRALYAKCGTVVIFLRK